MLRIVIKDLPVLEELTAEEMHGIVGGDNLSAAAPVQVPTLPSV